MTIYLRYKMTIEVKEMIIKAIVTDDNTVHYSHDPELLDNMLEQIKSEILSECKEILLEMLAERDNR